jgi:lipopolysaccharide/colanic/teichoic acid biosynthesis glycosyltransferase
MKNIKPFQIIKRIFDFFVSIFLILLFFPFIIFLSLLIYLEDKSFPLFFQERIGYRGRTFKMIKLRTMTNRNIEVNHNRYHCYENDPRITKVGKFLRKYSLDELPQLFNVFIGDMSLVGPRPAIVDELENEFIDQKNFLIIKERITVKPGITGYAQVNSRNDVTWNQKLELDKVYLTYKPLKRLFVDFFIIFLTISEIILSKGVYDKKI